MSNPALTTGLRANVETITPAKAAELLGSMVRNRTPKKGHVIRLVRDMQNGQWRLNGESVIIDTEGRLIDGQHRMMAVVEAGVSVSMMVVRGVPYGDIHTIDQSAARNFFDVNRLEGLGYSSPGAMAAAARSMQHYKQLGVDWKHDTIPMSMGEIKTLAAAHPTLAHAAAEVDKYKVVRKYMLIGQATWAYAIIDELYDTDVATLFFADLDRGVAPADLDPIMWLRRRMIENPSNLKRPNGRDMCAFYVKTFRRWYGEEEKRNTLMLRSDEPFPLFGNDRRMVGKLKAKAKDRDDTIKRDRVRSAAKKAGVEP